MDSNITAYVDLHMQELYALHKELCLIPAPSHLEHKRAEFCKAWFDANCREGAYIDDALNVIFPYEAEGSDRLSVIVAHTDTVFPDTEPMPFVEDGDYLYCPGVGDDTCSLAVMMMCVKYFCEHSVKTDGGILFVCNSCEEGLGDLKGVKQLFRDYEGRIAKFISYDSKMPGIADWCVGSHRYEVEVRTLGGHSWGAFGVKNAIAELAGIAKAIYSIDIPKKEGRKATYNVGTIEGGTSVNTIAQQARMLCEYRSNDKELLDIMEARFMDIFEAARGDEVTVDVRKVGDRPCMGEVDEAALLELKNIAASVVEEVTGERATYHSSSTDCNIPLSLGIPAIACGVYKGGGTHTREEWVLKSSMRPGFEVGIKTALKLVGANY